MKITLDSKEKTIEIIGNFTLQELLDELFALKDSYDDILKWKVVIPIQYSPYQINPEPIYVNEFRVTSVTDCDDVPGTSDGTITVTLDSDIWSSD